jgi:hypothetical protein
MASEPIYETPIAIRHLNSEEARAAATDFLLDHLGNQLVAGEPHIMVSAVRAVWVVPVQLAYIHTGILGSVGVVAVDEETGQVVAWTPIAQMKAAGRRIREAQNPDLAEQFKSFIATQSSKADQ